MDEEKGFKVIDRRTSSQESQSDDKDPEKAKEGKDSAPQEAPETKGDGFVMSESTDPSEDASSAPPGQIDFSTLVFSLATGALVNMGLTPDPNTQKVEKNLPLAKQNIDILNLLKEKTEGNLSDEESKLLDNLLAEIKLRFVESSR